jgi:hypothetical protein
MATLQIEVPLSPTIDDALGDIFSYFRNRRSLREQEKTARGSFEASLLTAKVPLSNGTEQYPANGRLETGQAGQL